MNLDLVDDYALALVQGIVALFVVLRMNAMHRNTPKLEVVGWWCLGVGAFSGMVFYLTEVYTKWGSVLGGIGVAILVALATQPEWRPFLANRRKELQQQFTLPFDRRGHELLGFGRQAESKIKERQ